MSQLSEFLYLFPVVVVLSLSRSVCFHRIYIEIYIQIVSSYKLTTLKSNLFSAILKYTIVNLYEACSRLCELKSHLGGAQNI